MKILVTGAKGFVGKNLCAQLNNIKEGKARNYPVEIDEVFEYDLDSTPEELDRYCREADFVFNLAGVNRPENPEDFRKGNFGFASTLLDTLKKHGNRRPVMMFSAPSNLHSVFDSSIPEAAHRWSYTEWQQQLDRLNKEEVAAVQAGEPRDWLLETHAICTEIYDFTPEGTKISYDYVAKYAPVIEQQFLRGGLRLARLLNEIYD